VQEDDVPRAIWKGSISFGLVNIPVSIFSAETRDELRFKQLDKRDMAPVRQKRVNEQSGDEVPWEAIARGFESSEGSYVLVTEEDIKAADPKATQTIEILQSVNKDDIDPAYFDKPYYLAPLKGGRKGYVLLRETLKRTGHVGIAKVVIRTKQYLAALFPVGDVLLLDLLRYAHELRSPAELDLPHETIEELGMSEKEVRMADKLIEALAEPWQPGEYRDEYRDQLLELIERKASEGEVHVLAAAAGAAEPPTAEIVDIMELLKRSVDATGKSGAAQDKDAVTQRKGRAASGGRRGRGAAAPDTPAADERKSA
jgi:DNA end-binding protein Ku